MLLLLSGCTKKAPEISGACNDVLSGTTIVMFDHTSFAGVVSSRQFWGGKRLNKKTEQGKLFRITELLEADSHIQMSFFRLGAIGPADTIPPGEIETEITVGLAHNGRMMDAVHVRSDQEQTEQAVESGRKSDIAVVEHGARI